MPVGYPLDHLGYHKPGQDLVMIHYTRPDTGQEPHYELISYPSKTENNPRWSE